MANGELAHAVRLREKGDHEAARQLLLELAERHPDDPEVAYQTAWVHDALGLEAEAVPFYQRALAGEGLAAGDRRGAFTGFGSTLRVLGRYGEALEVFDLALTEFPDDPALRVFRAMALYNSGQAREAVGTLLKLLAGTEQVGGYRRAVEYYADHLDETV